MKRTFIKNLLLVLCTIPLLLAFQCDEDYKPDEVIENLGLIGIEDNKTFFSVGDYIFITTSISDEQVTKDGKTINLRDYMLVDRLDLYYDLQINKIEPNDEESSYFVSDVQEIEGSIFTQDQNSFFNIISPYDETTASFSSKIGIKLSEPGLYVLKTATIKDRAHVISFDTQSSLGTLSMTTNIAKSNDEGIYTFIVE